MIAVRLLLDAATSCARVAGKCFLPCLACLAAASPLAAEQPTVHWQHASAMPPGAIGGQRLERGGPLHGYFQPVEIRVPGGAQVAVAADGTFQQAAKVVKVAMLVAPVYRLRVTQIQNHEGEEVYPTIEVIDRLYPPPGQAARFPIPVHITQQDLELALGGRFVTRVIYLEDPERALPVATDETEMNWFEAPAGQDPLAVADGLGRPVAILRIGSRVPETVEPDERFLFGCPPVRSLSVGTEAERQSQARTMVTYQNRDLGSDQHDRTAPK